MTETIICTRQRANKVMILIALCYCLLAISYAILVPPWEAPDEPAHYFYTVQLAARWRPPQDSGIRQTNNFYKDYAYMSSNYEWYQPALGYLPAAVIYTMIEIIAPSSLPTEIPHLNPLFGTDPFKDRSLFIHANPALFSIWDGNWGLLIVRVLSSLWGLVIIYAAYRVGGLLDKDWGWLGVAAACWLAFLPQFTFINSSVRSDTLTNAIAALVFLVSALMQIPSAPRNKYALALGALLGLGFLSKYTFVYIIPVGFLAVILTSPRSPRAWIKPMACLLTPILILACAYYLVFDEARTALMYTVSTELTIKPNALTLGYLREIPVPLLIDLFYARFGWANVTTPGILSWLGFGIWTLGAGITMTQTIYSLPKPQARQSLKIIVLLGAGMFLALAGVVRFNLAIFQPQGRLLFPVLVPWAVFLFWGFWQILPARGKLVLSIATTGFMFAFNLFALFFRLVPAYY